MTQLVQPTPTGAPPEHRIGLAGFAASARPEGETAGRTLSLAELTHGAIAPSTKDLLNLRDGLKRLLVADVGPATVASLLGVRPVEARLWLQGLGLAGRVPVPALLRHLPPDEDAPRPDGQPEMLTRARTSDRGLGARTPARMARRACAAKAPRAPARRHRAAAAPVRTRRPERPTRGGPAPLSQGRTGRPRSCRAAGLGDQALPVQELGEALVAPWSSAAGLWEKRGRVSQPGAAVELVVELGIGRHEQLPRLRPDG